MLACDSANVQYDYRLKLEEMALWVPCLVDGLQMHNVTWRGWTQRPMVYRPDKKGCFWRPPHMSCREFHDAVGRESGQLVPLNEDGLESTAVQGQDNHVTAAAERLNQFYTEETAELAYALYATDFEAFAYDRILFASMLEQSEQQQQHTAQLQQGLPGQRRNTGSASTGNAPPGVHTQAQGQYAAADAAADLSAFHNRVRTYAAGGSEGNSGGIAQSQNRPGARVWHSEAARLMARQLGLD